MLCVKCNGKTFVMESRLRANGEFSRRRACECGQRFSTVEVERTPGGNIPVRVKSYKVSTLTVKDVKKAVAEEFGVLVEDIDGRMRTANLALARQVVYFAAWKFANKSYAAIGRVLDRDHSTVIHGVRKISYLVGRNDIIKKHITVIERRLGV